MSVVVPPSPANHFRLFRLAEVSAASPLPEVLVLRGDVEVSEALVLADSLSALLTASRGDVVVDLSDVQFIDIASVRLLDLTRQLLLRQGRKLTFRSPSRLSVMVLGLFGLTSLIELGARAKHANLRLIPLLSQGLGALPDVDRAPHEARLHATRGSDLSRLQDLKTKRAMSALNFADDTGDSGPEGLQTVITTAANDDRAGEGAEKKALADLHQAYRAAQQRLQNVPATRPTARRETPTRPEVGGGHIEDRADTGIEHATRVGPKATNEELRPARRPGAAGQGRPQAFRTKIVPL